MNALTRITAMLLACAWWACCWSVEWPDSEKIESLLIAGRHQEIDALLQRYSTAKSNPPTDDEVTFLLAIVSESMSYRSDVTFADHALFMKAAHLVADAGDTSFKYQAVLLNRLAQDSQLFDTVDAPTTARLRKEVIELFVGIYERAQKRRDPAFAGKRIERGVKIPDDLLDRMIDSGIVFDPEGNPSGRRFAGKIKQEYEAVRAEHEKRYAEFLIQKDLLRILDQDNIILIKRIFTERYRRPPVDHAECHAYLSRVAGAPIRDIVCAIEQATQVQVPKELNITCGGKFGADDGF